MFVPSSLPPELESALASVRVLAEPMSQAGSSEERAAWLLGLRRVIDAAEATFTAALRRFDIHGDGETLHGAQTSAAWLRGALHLAAGDSSERVRIARAADGHLGNAVTGLFEGTLTFGHVRAIERATRSLPDENRAEAAELLTDLACHVDVARVRAAGQALRFTIDPDGGAAEAAARFDRRQLYLSPLLDGMTAVDGLLDAESAAIVGSALAPFLVPSDVNDERSAAQRRADGLVELAAVAIRSQDLPVLSGALTHLDVVVQVERLVGDLAGEPATIRSPLGEPVALPDAMLQRLGCDAAVARIVTGPNSVPLDLGRDHRLFSTGQRRALAYRDEGCRWPGCGRAARYTDAHHVVPWSRGGASDLNNAVLLCRHHHRLVHEGNWHLHMVDQALGSNGSLLVLGPRQQQMVSSPRAP